MLEFEKLLTLDLKQRSRVRLLTIGYAGLAYGCVFIPFILHAAEPTLPDRRLRVLHRRQSTLHRGVSTARPQARGAGSQMNWGQGPGG